MSDWTPEKTAEVVEAYVAQEPTEETTADIVKALAEEYGKTPNAIRLMLSKAQVYVKQATKTAAKPSTAKKEGGGGTRVNKAEAHATLKNAIEAKGLEVDDEIIDKLTGKAAIYLAGLIK